MVWVKDFRQVSEWNKEYIIYGIEIDLGKLIIIKANLSKHMDISQCILQIKIIHYMLP